MLFTNGGDARHGLRGHSVMSKLRHKWRHLWMAFTYPLVNNITRVFGGSLGIFTTFYRKQCSKHFFLGGGGSALGTDWKTNRFGQRRSLGRQRKYFLKEWSKGKVSITDMWLYYFIHYGSSHARTSVFVGVPLVFGVLLQCTASKGLSLSKNNLGRNSSKTTTATKNDYYFELTVMIVS